MSTTDGETEDRSAQEDAGPGKRSAEDRASEWPAETVELGKAPPRTVDDLNNVERTLYNAAMLDFERSREFLMGSMMGLSVVAEGMNLLATLRALEEIGGLLESFEGVSEVVVTAYGGGEVVPALDEDRLRLVHLRDFVVDTIDKASELFAADQYKQSYGELMSGMLNVRASLPQENDHE